MDDLEIVENDDDYYAFLNLPRDVSNNFIKFISSKSKNVSQSIFLIKKGDTRAN